ncbi:glycogen/starch/alpha-glucan phosphorylase [Leptolyngbya cf. ectocarpi LEGE 11479]|uniref:Alpha-1,4 glucan phosphorylase n=1 Tax=Leptolyngbya cf. ectocarpi LEGE 11479 TaxID=1828722 RepID=A0A928WYZ8_LEPEC|nr:glycogen/starch/alpha-glucan phosphorylase [Leptolyngbya ectocarpi]MBE9065994.1 glycogen/starch/alpha-glucan phosphorylase [Leptolyngbya cf. ectocarpi LEGE 11479]
MDTSLKTETTARLAIADSNEAAQQNLEHRTGTSIEAIKQAFLENLFFVQGKPVALATKHDYYMALAHLVRDRMLYRWNGTAESYTQDRCRTVCYLSAEFLMGPHLGNNLINMGIYDQVKAAMEELGLDFEDLLAQEVEPGLGNGGLGRLAACYLDSMASLEVPSLGYGIRYEFGIFEQGISQGWQIERTDKWLRHGNPWEVARPEWATEVMFGGHTESYTDAAGDYRVRWVPSQEVLGTPYDTPILGYQVDTANTLRLWKAEAIESFDFEVFNQGDYYGAVEEKVSSENLTKVLYPNDETLAGKRLRLKQQFFFVSCSLQDMFRILKGQTIPVEEFHEKFSIQLNDTHPAIASAELMRLLVDEYHLDWNIAWEITQQAMAYTNHTLLPEALEKWPISLFGSLLPRHLEIIYEINTRFLELVRMRFPKDSARLERMSLIDESGERYVRMANLACVSSHTINGVAKLHSELLKQTVLKDFYELFPEKFCNMTNGVTPRRWIALSNPRLTKMVTEKIGEGWLKELEKTKQLESLATDSGFQDEWHEMKSAAKRELAGRIHQQFGVLVDPTSMFDVQVKRIHEYKRQHLNALHIVTLYSQLKQNPQMEILPRTFIFGGKAAPGYHMAKLMIKLITSVGEMANKDPDLRNQLRVIFLPNYNVTNSQRVYPASDLSEQISTAGKEASGTGNMKFAMNGALTIGTLDGANVEIRDAVGAENFFLFGLTADEVAKMKFEGYTPRDYYLGNPYLKDAIDLIASGHFSHGDGSLFQPLLDKLLYQDPFMLLADYQAYVDCQRTVSKAYQDQRRWLEMSILNASRMGYFSSDRSVQEYCQRIWKVSPAPVDIDRYIKVSGRFGGELSCKLH